MNLLVDTQFARAGFVFVGMRNPEDAVVEGRYRNGGVEGQRLDGIRF